MFCWYLLSFWKYLIETVAESNWNEMSMWRQSRKKMGLEIKNKGDINELSGDKGKFSKMIMRGIEQA